MTRKQISRLIFHFDSFAIIFVLVFLWFGISILVDATIDKTALVQHSGQLIGIDSVVKKVKDKPLFKEITKELRLTITNEDKYFTSITTEHFGDITSNLKLMDSIIIFTKPKVWGIFGMRKRSAICHLVKGDHVIISFDKYQQSINGLFILPLLGSLIFFIIYWRRTRRRYIFDISSHP